MTADTLDLPVREAIRRKALAAVREGRVVVCRAMNDGDGTAPHSVIATVRTSRKDSDRTYVVDLLRSSGWSCTCPGWQQANSCGHLAAVQLVTGWGPRS